MTSAHFFLQGKGGVGKSTSAMLLAQYFAGKDMQLRCYDTDPVNQTFRSFKSLAAQHINLLTKGKITTSAFDQLMEEIVSNQGVCVIDNGASSFIPISSYLADNEVIPFLESQGVQVFIHCVVTGGQGVIDTLSGLDALAQITTSKNLVVWKNPYFGEITFNGKELDEMKVFQNNADKIYGVIEIPERNDDFVRDFSSLLKSSMTFSDGIQSGEFNLMGKQRLKVMQRDIAKQIEALGL